MKIIDATDLACPEPLMLLRQAVRSVARGESVMLHSVDAGTARDIPLYCQHMGHTLLDSDTTYTPHRFVVKKGR